MIGKRMELWVSRKDFMLFTTPFSVELLKEYGYIRIGHRAWWLW